MGSGGRNESNSHELPGIGENKIFHELDVHHVKKVGFKRSWAQEAEMSQITMTLLESARKKFFMNRRASCLESLIQTFSGSGGRNESNSHELARIGEKKIFHELDVHHVYKVGFTRFFAKEAEMSLIAMSLLESARRKFFMKSTYIMSKK